MLLEHTDTPTTCTKVKNMFPIITCTFRFICFKFKVSFFFYTQRDLFSLIFITRSYRTRTITRSSDGHYTALFTVGFSKTSYSHQGNFFTVAYLLYRVCNHHKGFLICCLNYYVDSVNSYYC